MWDLAAQRPTAVARRSSCPSAAATSKRRLRGLLPAWLAVVLAAIAPLCIGGFGRSDGVEGWRVGFSYPTCAGAHSDLQIHDPGMAVQARAGSRGAAPRALRRSAERPALSAKGEEGGEKNLSFLQRAGGAIKRNGVGYVVSYGLLSNISGCTLFAIAWALFVRNKRVCPLPLTPGPSMFFNACFALLKVPYMHPKFLVFYAAMYATVGSAIRPFRIAIAAALTGPMQKFFDFIQERLGCPRVLAWLIALLMVLCGSFGYLGIAIYTACWALGVPVEGFA